MQPPSKSSNNSALFLVCHLSDDPSLGVTTPTFAHSWKYVSYTETHALLFTIRSLVQYPTPLSRLGGVHTCCALSTFAFALARMALLAEQWSEYMADAAVHGSFTS